MKILSEDSRIETRRRVHEKVGPSRAAQRSAAHELIAAAEVSHRRIVAIDAVRAQMIRLQELQDRRAGGPTAGRRVDPQN